jgi:hypothetical protein
MSPWVKSGNEAFCALGPFLFLNPDIQLGVGRVSSWPTGNPSERTNKQPRFGSGSRMTVELFPDGFAKLSAAKAEKATHSRPNQ